MGLKEELVAGQGYAVSNGSFCNNTGDAVRIIEDQDSSNRVIGTIYMPGQEHDESAFRIKSCWIIGHLTHDLPFGQQLA